MNRAIMVNHIDSWGLQKEKVLQFAFLNSYFKTDQKYPLDDAILAHVYTSGYKFQPSKWRKIDEIPFDFIRRRVAIIMERDAEDKNHHILDRVMVTKGALEEVIKVCSFIEDADSRTNITFSREHYQKILNLSEEISNEGLRVIGVAIKRLETVCVWISSCSTSAFNKYNPSHFFQNCVPWVVLNYNSKKSHATL